MVASLQQQFEMQRSEVLSNVQAGELRKELDGLSRTKANQRKRDWLAALLAWSVYDDTMRKILAPILFTLIVETGGQAMQQVGLDPSQFDSTDLDVLNYSQQRAQKIAEDVDAETQKQLRATLSEGIDQDENDDQLGARVEEVFGAALTYRAVRIAVSETTRAQGFADVSAWTQAGSVTGKEWVVQSSNPCPFCQQMDGVIVGLDSDFLTLGDVLTAEGKTLKINYESIPYPPVHAHCQCALMPVMIA